MKRVLFICGDDAGISAALRAREPDRQVELTLVAANRSANFSHCETNLPDIYAAGGCVETWHRITGRHNYLPLGVRSHEQGQIAEENALSGNREFHGSLGTQSVRLPGIRARRGNLRSNGGGA